MWSVAFRNDERCSFCNRPWLGSCKIQIPFVKSIVTSKISFGSAKASSVYACGQSRSSSASVPRVTCTALIKHSHYWSRWAGMFKDISSPLYEFQQCFADTIQTCRCSLRKLACPSGACHWAFSLPQPIYAPNNQWVSVGSAEVCVSNPLLWLHFSQLLPLQRELF